MSAIFNVDALEPLFGHPKQCLLPHEKNRATPIIRIDADGNEEQFDSMTVASRQSGLGASVVKNIMCGQKKNSTPYKWRYLNSEVIR